MAVPAQRGQDHLLLAGLLAAQRLLDARRRARASARARARCPRCGRTGCRGEAVELRLAIASISPSSKMCGSAATCRGTAARRRGWGRDEVLAERVHLQQRRQPGRVPEVVSVHAPGQRRAGGGLDRPDNRVHPSGQLLPRNGKTSPAKFDPPPVQPTIRSGVSSGQLELRERLLADDGLVHQDVVEHAAERVPGVGAAAGRLDGLADRDAEGAGRVRVAASTAGPRWWPATGSGARSRRRSPSASGGTASGRRRRGPSRPRSPGRTARRRTRARCPTGPAPVSVVSRLVPSREL